MMHLVILGTSHSFQCGSSSVPAAHVRQFESELHRLVTKYEIRRIAEEMSLDGLKHHGVNQTLGEKVAADLSLEHCNVDLSVQERNSLGLSKEPRDTVREICKPTDCGVWFDESMDIVIDEVRERVWLSRLLLSKVWPALFICGAEHVQSIRQIWHRLGLEYSIAHKDYAP